MLSTVQEFQFQHYIIAMNSEGVFACEGYVFPECQDVNEVVLAIWGMPNKYKNLPTITTACKTAFF